MTMPRMTGDRLAAEVLKVSYSNSLVPCLESEGGFGHIVEPVFRLVRKSD